MLIPMRMLLVVSSLRKLNLQDMQRTLGFQVLLIAISSTVLHRILRCFCLSHQSKPRVSKSTRGHIAHSEVCSAGFKRGPRIEH